MKDIQENKPVFLKPLKIKNKENLRSFPSQEIPMEDMIIKYNVVSRIRS